PLITPLLPELSSSIKEDEISNGMRLAFRFLLLGVLPGSFLFAAVSKQLVDFFSGGGVYLTGSSSLELIAIFYVFYGIQSILVIMFQAIGKTVYAMIVGLATAATDIGISVVLVPRIGLLGAASAKVSVAIVGAILALYLGKSFLGKLGHLSFYSKSILAAVIPFSVTYALSYYVSIQVVTLVPYAVVFVVVFLLCVKQFKLLTDEDRAFITHLIPKILHRLIGHL
ncbi:MAG: polysaccharide biosynthesis C-terminal domain-containing protein, partial [Nitrososphaerota archaeon]|nr:polysaccharide biosynthesis C-terminal domain-containing protein [Nitrososphaerota archaeon]